MIEFREEERAYHRRLIVQSLACGLLGAGLTLFGQYAVAQLGG